MKTTQPQTRPRPGFARFSLPLITCFVLSLASCKKEADVVTPEPPVEVPTQPQTPADAVTPVATPEGALITATIGPAGGTLESADKRLRVAIPAGALPSNQTISVQPLNHNHCPLGTGRAFRLMPHGLTFAKPATISFHYDEADVNGSAPQLLRVAYQNEKGSWQSPATKGIDTTTHTLTVQTTHFSDWGLFHRMELTPNQAFVSPGEEVDLKVLEIPINPYDDDQLVPIPTYVPGKYIEKWVVRGDGLVVHTQTEGVYYAPKTIPAANPEAVTVFLNQSTTIDGQVFKDLRLVSNMYVIPQGLTFRINGGKWIHTLATARVIGGGLYLDLTGGTMAEGNRWGVNLHTTQLPLETTDNLVTTSAGMTMPWSVAPTSPLFHLTDEKGDVYYKHVYPVGRVFYPSPGALTFYRFGKVGDYAIGKFELQKAGVYNDTRGYIGTARVEGFFRMKREM